MSGEPMNFSKVKPKSAMDRWIKEEMSNIKIENINLVQAESLIQQAIDSLIEANRFHRIPGSTEVLEKLTYMRDLLIKEII